MSFGAVILRLRASFGPRMQVLTAFLNGSPTGHILLIASPLARLTWCGGLSAAIYLFCFTGQYPIARGLAKPLEHFGRMTGPSWGPTVLLVASLAGLFAFYGAALRLCPRSEDSRWTLGVVCVS